MDKTYKNGIIGYVYLMWLITLAVAFFGIWKQLLAPFVICASFIITIWCIVWIIKKKYYSVSLGICAVYTAHLSLILVFKLANWQFQVSESWFWIALLANTILAILQLWISTKSNKKRIERNIIKTISPLTVGFFIYPIISMIGKGVKGKISNDTAVIVVICCLFFFVLAGNFGIIILVKNNQK